ncbi:MarR family winged helix-turn-helix transcriptional regulator [Pedobacter sp. MC2016-24]|uniref:MarR family winged helix-turn-helix transcriptional regulator n=1 Tax=Pedobacter sp. MC2016-24 TaxID=2780090 RepID=UPI001D16CFC3|nr:MarR family transcriptional regulator [Pedobacter sp. MC2016-24]
MKNMSNAELALGLGRAVIEMRSKTRQYIQAKIKEHRLNITYEMLEVLICLWEKDGRNQQEIADKIIKEKASMTYLIDNLVKRHLVKRTEDENDRRNKLIYLMPGGIALQDKMLPWATEMYTLAASGLTSKSILEATILIKQMTKNLN